MSRFNLSALAVRERSITLFLIVAIILSGTYAFLRLGRAQQTPSLVAMRDALRSSAHGCLRFLGSAGMIDSAGSGYRSLNTV